MQFFTIHFLTEHVDIVVTYPYGYTLLLFVILHHKSLTNNSLILMVSRDIILALSGPFKADRLRALDELEGTLKPDILNVLKDIENVRLDLLDCRNKDRYLEILLKLVVDSKTEEAEIYAFNHLVGTLYINFEKFWGPTVRTLIDIIKISRIRNLLLDLLIDQLGTTTKYIYQAEQETKTPDRPDHVLHRNFILQLLAKFPEYIESNSQQFMDLLLVFSKNELLTSPFIEKFSYQDLTCSYDSRKQKHKIEVQKTKETMITMFRIVQSFQDISQIHRKQEFKDLILDLMLCRDAGVQRVAFNCLAVYDTKFLTPYVDKILRLLDEKRVRSELSLFSIDSESSHIREDHRAQVIPIVHRVLFGRMLSRVDKKSSGRDKADMRKSIVMRYISGCTVKEILDFFGILFDPIYNFIECSYDDLDQTLRQAMNIQKYLPLNKLQAMLTTLSAYLEYVAHQKDETLPHVLKLICIITWYVVVPLEDDVISGQIDQPCLETLRSLRRNCLCIVTDFLNTSQYYNYKSGEIDFLFKYVIWPSSCSFVDRNHASVTPILKLIEALAQNEVYHHLLLKRSDEDSNMYLLQLIMVLYNDPKIERTVSLFLARMISKLLAIKSDDEMDDEYENDDKEENVVIEPVESFDHLLPKYDLNLYTATDAAKLGLKMILKYTPIIFERLGIICEKSIEKKDGSIRLENCELQILSVLSGYVKDSIQCMSASSLLLATLDYQKKPSMIISTLKTVQDLMRNVQDSIDPKIINYIANVLSYQRDMEQRRELSNLINVIAKIDTRLSKVSSGIHLLNCANENLVDLPDLEKWGEGFRVVFDYIDNLDRTQMNDPNEITCPLILLLHQIGYIINTVDKYEFSVRENCEIFYEKLAKKISLVDVETNKKLLDNLANG